MPTTPPILHRVPRRLAAAGLVSLALLPGMAWSATPADAAADGPGATGKRPRICLVLSGGGARGAAHVGVLKVLEELHVPVHCIVGTSMGALVGAAYASGMSLREMDAVIGGISTERLFKEKPPRQELSMRRKQDDYGLFFTPEIGIKGTDLTFAKGLVSGVQLETVLRQLSKVKGFHRFDELPIQFRSIATDLVTGKAVVFSEGELAEVMRASMSVPGAVAPAEFDGMMLVDGMLTSNLPVETARTLQPDVIIAVNVGTPLLKREELSGVLGVMGQMLSILTEQNVQQSLSTLRPTDILITPQLADYSTGDFDDLPKIVPLGETAAREVADRLAALALPAEEYAALRQAQQVVVADDTRRIDQIRFAPMNSVNPLALQAVMETAANQPLDQATLDKDMRRIYGSGSFEHVAYHFLDEPGGRILVVDAAEKSWGLNTVRFGLGLSSDFKGSAYFNVVGSYRRNWVNSLGAQWRTDLQVGQTSSLATEFYQPLVPSELLFVAPRASIERTMTDVYQGASRIASFRTTTTLAGLDIGSMFGRYGEARLGIVGGMLRPSLETGPLFLQPANPKASVGAVTAKLQLDQLDSARFPRNGWRALSRVFASTGSLGADDEYKKWDVDGSYAYSFGEHTFNLAATLGGRLGSDPLPRYDLFQWGGFLQQSGYATGQLLGEKLRFARVMYYHRIFRGTIFEGAYGGASFEYGKMDQPLVPGSPQGWLRSASLFVAADTPLGPVYLAYGRARDGNSSLYFYLGRPF